MSRNELIAKIEALHEWEAHIKKLSHYYYSGIAVTQRSSWFVIPDEIFQKRTCSYKIRTYGTVPISHSVMNNNHRFNENADSPRVKYTLFSEAGEILFLLY